MVNDGDLFGKHVLEARQHRKMSRAELIRDMETYGVTMHPTTLKRIEDGQQIAKINEAQAFAQALEVPLTFLIYGSDWDKNALRGLMNKTLEAAVEAALAWERWDTLRTDLASEVHYLEIEDLETFVEGGMDEDLKDGIEWVTHPSSIFQVLDHLEWRPTSNDLKAPNGDRALRRWNHLVSYYLNTSKPLIDRLPRTLLKQADFASKQSPEDAERKHNPQDSSE